MEELAGHLDLIQAPFAPEHATLERFAIGEAEAIINRTSLGKRFTM